MRGSDLWLGDVVRALAALDLTSAEPATAQRGETRLRNGVLELCGFAIEAESEPDESARPAEEGPEETDQPVAAERDDGVAEDLASAPPPIPPPASTVPLLEPIDRGPAASNPWAGVKALPLDRHARKLRPLEERELFELPAARHLLTDIVATQVPGASLDVPRAVAELAAGRVLREIPYHPERSVRRGVQLLLDRGKGLEPHHREQRHLASTLRRIVGKGKVAELGFTDLPLERVGPGPMSGWGEYRPPEPGTPVLAVTDVGVSGEGMESAAELVSEWSAIADRLEQRGSTFTMLIPYPPDRWPSELCRPLRAVPWTDRTTMRTARVALQGTPKRLPKLKALAPTKAIPAAQGPSARLVALLAESRPQLVELAELLSPAVRIEPKLLRRLRLAVTPHIDVGIESDLWLSPLVRASDEQGFSFGDDHAAELRRRLAVRWEREDRRPVLEAARDIMARAHDGDSEAVKLEEEVAWLAVMDAQDEIEAKLAPAIAALTQSGRPALRYWAAQAAERLPAQARATGSGWALTQYGSNRARTRDDVPDGVPIDHVLATLPKERLLVRYLGSTLEIGALSGTGLAAIEVPRTRPMTIEVDGRAYTIPAGGSVEVPASGAVTLETAAGMRYHLEPATTRELDVVSSTVEVIGRGGSATGFFVAPDLLVTALTAVEMTGEVDREVQIKWREGLLAGWVVAAGLGIAAVRLQRPLADVDPVPISRGTAPHGESVAWSGAVADGGSVRAVSGSWDGESGLTFDEGAPFSEGAPMIADGRLVGVLLAAGTAS